MWLQGKIFATRKFINNGWPRFFAGHRFTIASANFRGIFPMYAHVCVHKRRNTHGWDHVFHETLFAHSEVLANKCVFTRSLHSFDDSSLDLSIFFLLNISASFFTCLFVPLINFSLEIIDQFKVNHFYGLFYLYLIYSLFNVSWI